MRVRANTVRNGLNAARQLLGLKLRDSREVIRSGGEDGLYRCTLANGLVVEVTIRGNWPRGKCMEAGFVRHDTVPICHGDQVLISGL